MTRPLPEWNPTPFMRVAADFALPFIHDTPVPIFPCNPLNKRPCTEHGYKDATIDLGHIRAWDKRWPNSMVGIPTGQVTRHIVADFDADKGGLETLEKYERERCELPDGCTSFTPGGGYHIRLRIPEGVIIQRSIGELGPGFDVLGEGSYAIAPGSVRGDGKAYEFAEGSSWDDMPDAPDVVLFDAMWPSEDERAKLADIGIRGPDDFKGLPPREWREHVAKLDPRLKPAVRSELPLLEGRKKRLLEYVETGAAEDLEKLAKTVQGLRNHTAIRVCFKLWRNLRGADYEGLDISELEDHYEARFAEAVAETGLEKADEVARDMWERCRAEAPPRNLAHVGRKDDPASEQKQKRKISFTAYKCVDPRTEIDPRDWLYRSHYLRNAVTGTVAPGGTYKTSNTIVEAVSMACGLDLLTWEPPKPGKPAEPPKAIRRLHVAVWNGEESAEEMQRKVEAVRLYYGISAQQIEGWLFVDNGHDLPIKVASDDGKGFTIAEPEYEALSDALEGSEIDVLILDPFVSVHAVSENDNNRIDAVVKRFGRIAKKAKCGIELVHHTRKLNGEEATIDASRGASAFRDGCRSVRVLNKMTDDEARKARITDDHRLYFRIEDGKGNYRPAEKAVWRKAESAALGNARPGVGSEPGLAQDHVGVVTRFDWPGPTDGLGDAELELARAALRVGKHRAYPSAEGWAGYAVGEALGYDMRKPEKDGPPNPSWELVKSALAAWTKGGHFEEYRDHDEKGVERPFLRTKLPTSTP